MKLITSEQFKQDLDTLKQAFEKTYPSLYRFKSKLQIDKLFDSCKSILGEHTTSVDFYATTKYLLSALGDGHLSCYPSGTLRSGFDKQSFFPLSLVFLNNGVYNYYVHPLVPKGAKIISINGVPLQSIRNKVYKYIESDGDIETAKNWRLNKAFGFYYFLVYGDKQTFKVRYKSNDGTITTTDLKSEQRNNTAWSGYELSTKTDVLDLSFPKKNVAVLTVKTFSRQVLIDAKKDFTAFLDSSFKTINQKDIDNLIIDLRSNSGGADVYGSYLYSYLTNKPFLYYKEIKTTVKDLTTKDHPNLGYQKPANMHYGGRVFVLTNGLTFSAAAEFCSIFKSNRRGMFIGEETGGSYYGNTSGSFVETVLPYSGIIVSIPTAKYVMAVKEIKPMSGAITPDYLVVPTIKDILQNKDIQLEQAINIVTEK